MKSDYFPRCFDPVLKDFVWKIAPRQRTFLGPRATVPSEDPSLFVQLQGDMRTNDKTKLVKYGETLAKQPSLDCNGQACESFKERCTHVSSGFDTTLLCTL